jgi:hypothetical protein
MKNHTPRYNTAGTSKKNGHDAQQVKDLLHRLLRQCQFEEKPHDI